MTPRRIRILLAPALSGILLLAASHSARAVVDCSIPSQRDATCVSSVNNAGALNTSNSALSSILRGSNAIPMAGVPIPTPLVPNECVTVPLTLWAYDPVSFATPMPSFVTQTTGGYLGSGGHGSPLEACSSSTDGSCSAWVPAGYPYLFTGNNNFVACTGANVLGSISCPISGGAAYATTNPNAGSNFSALMIACKKGTASLGSTVAGAPFSWWTNCTASAQCSFFMVYPSPPQESAGGL